MSKDKVLEVHYLQRTPTAVKYGHVNQLTATHTRPAGTIDAITTHHHMFRFRKRLINRRKKNRYATLTGTMTNHQSVAAASFIAQLGKRITGHDEATSRIVQHNLNGDEGPGYVTEVHDKIVAALTPGKALENMIEPMLREVTTYLEALKQNNEVDLFVWTRNMVTMCSTRAIYGPENPFNKNAYYKDLFW